VPNSSTIYGHSNATGAISTGAVFWGDTPAYGAQKPSMESFSSAGGTPILFYTDGKRTKEVVRQKPEIMAPDGGNTTFFGQLVDGKYYFFGTSAAAPHAAAVAALMQESAGYTLSRDQILKAMQETAFDMEEPGFDFDSGYGFLNALKAVGAVAKQRTQSLTLLNASNGREIQTIREGSVINLTRLVTEKVRFRALTGPLQVGSVVLELNGKKITENKAPYDYPGSTDSFELKPGDYTLTATSYTQAQGKGEAGIPLTIHFKVVEEEIVRFELINGANGKVIKTLETGDVLYLPDLPKKLNIRAITNPGEVGSVQFSLNGIVTVENQGPYDLAGHSGGSINFNTGNYTLSATTYPEALANGKAGHTKTISFGATSVQADIAKIADKLKTNKNKDELTVFPNPFQQRAKVKFKAAEASSASLIIYNLNGQPVTTLFNGNVEAGKLYEFELDGGKLPGGLYVSRLVTKLGVVHQTIKLQK
ncbi:MAG: S8 family peptidase, partial [Bacteroidota bacterium]|nr:S8 family peptidase [Bacteroidota bacterium]